MNTRVLAAAPREFLVARPSLFAHAFNIDGCAGKRGLGVCLWAFEGEAEAVEQLLARDTGLHLNFLHVRAQRYPDSSGKRNSGCWADREPHPELRAEIRSSLGSRVEIQL